ncbi:MAG: glycosyltransferase [Mobilitalea sp.]
MIKVSVIVPIHNVEKYLRRCLDSIINQTLEEIEIILVNDASSDSSMDIMKEYEEKDNRIICIHFESNKMVGAARNKGIDCAKGEYLTFVDSDDYLDLTMLEKMYTKAKMTDSDMAYGLYHYTKENGNVIKDVYLYPPEYCGEVTLAKKRGAINKLAFPWGKLYRRSLWIESKVRFSEGIIYEDGPTIPLIFLYLKRCTLVDEALYYYVLHDNSLMNKRNSKSHFDIQKSAFDFKDKMVDRGLYEIYKEETNFFFILRYYKILLEICIKFYDNIPLDVMNGMRNYMKRNYRDYKKNQYYLTLTGEERVLLFMNDINPKLAVWWSHNRGKVMKAIGKQREGIFYYKSYYDKSRDKLSQLFEKYKDYKIGIWGAGLKKTALLKSLKNESSHQIEYDIIVNEKEVISGKEVYLNNVIGALDVIFVINPSFYVSIKELIAQSGRRIKLVNLEDYLNGFLDLKNV